MEKEETEKKEVVPQATPEAPLQDPVEAELQKEKERKTYTDKEKAAFNLKKNAERAKELGVDPAEVLDLKKDEDEGGDEVPDWYKREKAKEATKTALQMADELQDQNVRNLVKSYLENRIRPSGNPEDDFRLALGAVSSIKNGQIIEEINRPGGAKKTALGGSAPLKTEPDFTPTPEEAALMAPPFNITKEQILKNRPK